MVKGDVNINRLLANTKGHTLYRTSEENIRWRKGRLTRRTMNGFDLTVWIASGDFLGGYLVSI